MNSVGILFIFGIIILTIEARYFYVEEPKSYYDYPPFFRDDNGEQSSRDLDMTFLATSDPSGQSDKIDSFATHPGDQFYGRADRPMVNIARDINLPMYYDWQEVPGRRIIYSDPFVSREKNRKFVKLDDAHKGELILELRIIANNNNGV